jgi:iron-sulfur cluster repair protein YtfE (RIC family)
MTTSDVASGSASLDLTDARLLHRAANRELDRLTGSILAVHGDTARASAVAERLISTLNAISAYQVSSYEIVWPRLRHRRPSDTLRVLGLRERYVGVTAQIDEIVHLCDQWRTMPDSAASANLASIVEKFRCELSDVMSEEEVSYFPLVQECITQAEWNQVGEVSYSASSRSASSLQLSIMLLDASDAERRVVLQKMPFEVVAHWFLVGKVASRRILNA